MHPEKLNPATLAACGARNKDQADGSINSDNSHPTRALQVARLTRHCAISVAMAAVLAPMIHGEARNA